MKITDETLNTGDLAQVIDAHCEAATEWLGHTFTVADFVIADEAFCFGCGNTMPGGKYPKDADGRAWAYAKRVPPLGELEEEDRVVEVTA